SDLSIDEVRHTTKERRQAGARCLVMKGDASWTSPCAPRRDGFREVLRFPYFKNEHLNSQPSGRGFHGLHGPGAASFLVPEDRGARKTWHALAQQVQPLRAQFRVLERHAGDVSSRVREALDESHAHRIVRGN